MNQEFGNSSRFAFAIHAESRGYEHFHRRQLQAEIPQKL